MKKYHNNHQDVLLSLVYGTVLYGDELGIIDGNYEGRLLGFVLGVLLGFMLEMAYSAELGIILKI